MFENLFNKTDDEIAAENRQKDFAREQTNFQAGNDANSDMIYMQEKQQRRDLLQWQQDLKDEVYMLKMKLLGYVIENDKYVYHEEFRICNELFIYQILDPILSNFVSRGFSNSNLDTHTINIRLKKTCNSVAASLAHSHERYDVKFENFEVIDSELKSILVPAAYRALNGWTKRTDSTMFKSIEASHSSNNEENKKKIGLFGW